MIIIVGISGSGKGTQCQLLKEELGYAYLSTGDMIRGYASPEVRAKAQQGTLLDDEEMIAIAADALRQEPDVNKVILDGLPRTVRQAEWLVSQVAQATYNVEAVVNLTLAPEVVRERLLHRGRSDDTPEIIAARLAWYSDSVSPAIDVCRREGLPVIDIDGSGAVQDVHSSILTALKGIGIKPIR